MIAEPEATATCCLLSNTYVIGNAFQFRRGEKAPNAFVTASQIRVLTPTTGSNRSSMTAAFNQSNMIILIDTDAGITGIGEGGSPDLVASLAPSVIGR